MTTTVGKLFVVLNLVASMAMAVTALLAYSSSIDWTTAFPSAANPGVRLPLKAADTEIEDLKKNMGIAEASFEAAQQELCRAEDTRREERVWYDGELRLVTEGKDPLREVEKDKGLPRLDDKKRPKMVDPARELTKEQEKEGAENKVLMPLPVYVAELARKRLRHREVQDELRKYAELDARLTNELAGDPERGTRGLRRHLADERTKRLGIVDEFGIVEGQRINTRVEAELSLKRLELLDERIQELARHLKQKYKVDVPAKWR